MKKLFRISDNGVICRYLLSTSSAFMILLLFIPVTASDSSDVNTIEVSGTATVVDLIDNTLMLQTGQKEIKIFADTATVFSGINSLAELDEGQVIAVTYRPFGIVNHAERINCEACAENPDESSESDAVSLPDPLYQRRGKPKQGLNSQQLP
ncbi:MAG: hypothetical protein JXA18_01810 [Chitinispirillaceae bacterium]|nr:hypothetical protein [Chitinispirillaceae bacterium]